MSAAALGLQRLYIIRRLQAVFEWPHEVAERLTKIRSHAEHSPEGVHPTHDLQACCLAPSNLKHAYVLVGVTILIRVKDTEQLGHS